MTKRKEADKRERILLLYLGIYESVKSKKISGWLRVTKYDIDNKDSPDHPEQDSRFLLYDYRLKNKAYASVGEIYEIPVEDGGASIYSNEFKWVGTWKNKKQVAKWAARDEAVNAELDSKGKMKSIGRNKPLKEYLEPINAAYKRANGAQKAQLLAQVVKYVTGR